MSTARWHVARWPALAWIETGLKLGAFAAAGVAIVAGRGMREPTVWTAPAIARIAILGTLAGGLTAAIADRWRDRELVSIGFVLLSNAAHWSVVAVILSSPTTASPWFAVFLGLMLAGDLAKVVFLRVHRFTTRGASPAVMLGLTSAYVLGYAAVLLLEVIPR